MKIAMVSQEMIACIKPALNVPETTDFVEENSMHGTEKEVSHVSFSTDESYVSCSCPWFRRNRSNISLLSLKVGIDLSKTCHHSTETTLCIQLMKIYFSKKMKMNVW